MTQHSPRLLDGPLSRPLPVADIPTHLLVQLLGGSLAADPPMAGVWPQSSPRLPGYSPVAHYRPMWTRRKRDCCGKLRFYASSERRSSSGQSGIASSVLQLCAGSMKACRRRRLPKDLLPVLWLGRWGLGQARAVMATRLAVPRGGSPYRRFRSSLPYRFCQGPG